VAKALRRDHGFAGYIHLKTIPEANPWLIEQAGIWADRLSINLELATPQSLARLAPEKHAPTIASAMGQMHERIAEAKEEGRRFSPAGQSTQIIVGADETTDHSLLATSAALYDKYAMRRIYYSAFSPIPEPSALLPIKSPPLQRENRLYQADWLLRHYGFSVYEIASGGENGMLDLEIDPKFAWALKNRGRFPVDVNTADREMLLRVPGLGKRVVDKIIAARRHARLRLADVARLTAGLKRVRPVLITADHRPSQVIDRLDLRQQLTSGPRQLACFDGARSYRSTRGRRSRRVSPRCANSGCAQCLAAGSFVVLRQFARIVR
jgi:predicted DNA-binding helix-hairpin-helix protein